MASSRNNALEFSSVGSIILDGDNHPSTPTGSYGAIQFLKDTQITSITAQNITNEDELYVGIGAGTIIYGKISAVTIATGGLVAVHKV